MAPGKRKQAALTAQFLDLDAADKGEEETEVEDRESDDELLLESNSKDGDNCPKIVMDSPADQNQQDLDAFFDSLAARYGPHSPAPSTTTSIPTPSSATNTGKSSASIPIRSNKSLSTKPKTQHDSGEAYPRATLSQRDPLVKTIPNVQSETPTYQLLDPEEQQLMMWQREWLLNLPPKNPWELEEARQTYLDEVWVRHMDWVTIRSGLYRGDTGLAIGVSEKEASDIRQLTNTELFTEFRRHYRFRSYEAILDLSVHVFDVFLVPRINSPKRKCSDARNRARCPVPQLFDHKSYSGVCLGAISPWDLPPNSEKPSHECEDIIYKEQTFNDGLLIARFPASQLKLAASISPCLEKQFLSSKHPWVHHAPLPHPANWSFEEGEEVTWKGSSRTFKTGRFVNLVVTSRSLVPQTAIVSFLDGLFPVPSCDLLKTLEIDDHIEFTTGRYRGQVGHIMGQRDVSIMVFLPQERSVVSAHVNSAKRVTPPDATSTELVDQQQALVGRKKELVPVPWRGAEVRVTRGGLMGSRGIVQTVERVEA
ncbi:hypothetical protein V5O48_006472 [Marasmius crinis-equi]|uniref:KOW domain-containing protein n=1 Tax=Marasmius crinis-equi TaxID=585013 RepID=A0ABR3FJG0_9AGAR